MISKMMHVPVYIFLLIKPDILVCVCMHAYIDLTLALAPDHDDVYEVPVVKDVHEVIDHGAPDLAAELAVDPAIDPHPIIQDPIY